MACTIAVTLSFRALSTATYAANPPTNGQTEENADIAALMPPKEPMYHLLAFQNFFGTWSQCNPAITMRSFWSKCSAKIAISPVDRIQLEDVQNCITRLHTAVFVPPGDSKNGGYYLPRSLVLPHIELRSILCSTEDPKTNIKRLNTISPGTHNDEWFRTTANTILGGMSQDQQSYLLQALNFYGTALDYPRRNTIFMKAHVFCFRA